jgi:hypothetical protein
LSVAPTSAASLHIFSTSVTFMVSACRIASSLSSAAAYAVKIFFSHFLCASSIDDTFVPLTRSRKTSVSTAHAYLRCTGGREGREGGRGAVREVGERSTAISKRKRAAEEEEEAGRRATHWRTSSTSNRSTRFSSDHPEELYRHDASRTRASVKRCAPSSLIRSPVGAPFFPYTIVHCWKIKSTRCDGMFLRFFWSLQSLTNFQNSCEDISAALPAPAPEAQ